MGENEPSVEEEAEVAEGLRHAYSVPAATGDTTATVEDTATSLEELMKQMKSM